MPSAALAEQPPALLGDQRPRILWVPPHDPSGVGAEAVGLAADVGLELDDWEAFVLSESLNERAGKWAAFEVGCLVSRQNGKGAILEAREIAGLFLLDERLILHSAHEYKTAAEGFKRLLWLVEGSDMLRKRVRQVRTSHGEEGIELLNGARLRFIARSTGSGRGFSGDCVILDEAQNLPDAAVEALLPTMSARPNPQLWYTFTGADRDLAPCDHTARVRRRGIAGQDPGLCYFEWSIDPHDEFCGSDCVAHDDPGAVRSWAKANPGLGIRISVEHVARERAAMSPEGFARERLGVGRWPLERGVWLVISQEQWLALTDRTSEVQDPVALAVNVSWDRSEGSIAVAGRRADGLFHVEIVDKHERTDWIVPRVVELQRWKPLATVVRSRGPAGFLVPELEAAGVEVTNLSSTEGAQACGLLYQSVTDTKNLRHLGQPELTTALAATTRKPVGDAWTWVAKDGAFGAQLSPLYAVTDALWGYATKAHLPGPVMPAIY